MSLRSIVKPFVVGIFLIGIAMPVFAEGYLPKSGFADIVEKLLPAVVNISTTQKVEASASNDMEDMLQEMPFPPGSQLEELFKEFSERRKKSQSQDAAPHKATSLGSGFVIDASGLIVTNGHVIQDADEINVILQDNTNLKAELVGVDKKTDLAVLRVKPAKPLIAVGWGDSDKTRVGDVVLAIGNPYGLGGTVTAGIISARSRDISSGPYDDYLQTDAAINRGNSGGPMFNVEGQVIGINTAIFSPSGGSVGIGFAIPSSMAREVVEQLKTSGHTRRGWLGVRIQAVTPEIAESMGLGKERGALVNSNTAEGPAEKAGVKSGDVILTFDGKDVTEMKKLPRIVAETPVDKTVPMIVWRGGKEVALKVKVGELEKNEKDEDAANAKETKEDSAPMVAKAEKLDDLGMSLTALTPENRKKYSIKSDVKGVLISEVAGNGAARERGLSAGDVIMEVAQQEVTTPTEVIKAVKASGADGKPVLMLINHQGDSRFVGLPTKKKAEEKTEKKDAPEKK